MAPDHALPLEMILDGLGDAITVFDATGMVRYANQAAARMLSFPSVEALLATPVADILRGYDLLDSEGQPLDPAVLPSRKAFITQRPHEMIVRFRVRATNEERWSNVRANPLISPEGKVIFCVNIFRDVTDWRRASELERLRAQFVSRASTVLASSVAYETTLAHVADLAVPEMADWAAVDLLHEDKLQRLAVAHVDPEKIRLVQELYERSPNQTLQRVLQTGKSELVSRMTPEMLEAGATSQEHLRAALALQVRSCICVPLHVRGRTVGVVTFASSRRDYDDNDLSVAETLGDRASVAMENALLFRELDSANRAKDEFLALLGHELRNPLAPILTALQLMELRDGNAFTRERTIIERQVRHVVRLVDDLLDVSRITRGKIELKKELVDLADVISKSLEISGPLLEDRQHKVNVAVPRGLTLDADPIRLQQVFSNLLNNAAKYTERGGHITVQAERHDEQIQVCIRDSGIGIAPDMLPRVFDLFVQEQQASDRAHGGLGLGLTIVRSLVRMHGGEVSVRSEGPGRGSAFTVALKAAMQTVMAPVPRQLLKDVSRARLLVVDDNADAAELLGAALELVGYEVSRAHDGPSALLLAADAPPRLALLDIGLPVMDGYELAAHLRRMPGLEGLKLVALTGYGQASDRVRARAAGFDAHMVKPVDMPELQRTIERLLSASET